MPKATDAEQWITERSFR